MKKLIIIITALIVSINIFAQGIEFEHCTFSEALAKAKKENKMVFMDCYTTWCGPCKMLAKNVFSKKEVGDFFNKKYINIKIDCEKGEGIDIAKKYEVNAFPTLLFIDCNGNVIHKFVGGTSVQGLLEHGAIANDPSKHLGAMHKKYESGERNVKFLSHYIKTMFKAGERENLLSIGQDFISNTTKKQLLNEDALNVLGYTKALQYDSKIFKYIIASKDKIIAIEGIGQRGYDGIIGQSISGHLYNKATECSTLDEFNAEIEKTKKYLVIPNQKMVEMNLRHAFYYAHKKYDLWYQSNMEQVSEVMKVNKPKANTMLVRVALRVSKDSVFKRTGICQRAINDIKSYISDNEDGISGYFCLARLYKSEANKKNALKYINKYITIANERKIQLHTQVYKVKEEIEAM